MGAPIWRQSRSLDFQTLQTPSKRADCLMFNPIILLLSRLIETENLVK
jgi:hypothetical protein